MRLLAIAAISMPTLAQAKDFYKGKTLTVVIGYSPGGGFDAYGRLVARHIGAHIPGKPAVVVQNMPGAGSLVAVRSLNATQPKDGTVMVTFNSGVITQSILTPQTTKLDFRNFSWVGVASPIFTVCFGYGPKGASSWHDLMQRKEFILGSTAKGTLDYIDGAILRGVFKAPVKQILGFPGSAEIRLAIARGELDGDCSDFNSIPPDWIRTDQAHPFVRFTKAKLPTMSGDAKFIDDFATTQRQKSLLAVLDAADEIGRPFIMSNAVPTDRVRILQKAFDDTMKDPAFLADAQKEHLAAYPVAGETARQIVAKITAAPPEIIAEAKKLVFE